ncbi:MULTISPECIES: dipeptidase [unclassified Microbacterium]|uniref:dipeptidase n=1 Tax=unclassified Microbacterium TaxID=2609290 RepID=UPI000CFCE275|nr:MULTISPECIES: membrane dipeptidase [unclassified Microbacterium]PQZ49895.1 membrane dipeptidase [Microbacterium sp. MYb43]PQZ72560.1 membrane dipeptidase [Microbacterium sp. MYb40]PRB14907.1 membrane dipeptidase [Microbacterium sp. MYb54]PRB21655.1 membrane dipeptidase [Microbacterium sp. MYb50]PRB64133.1 membrane dipeptidase [Microbacterium sp. MYb24]
MTANDALDLHRRAVVADAHNDLLCSVASRPSDQWSEYFRAQWLPQLQQGGVDLQVLPVFVDDVYRPEGALRRTFRMIEAAHRLADGNADTVGLCLDGDDVDRVIGEGRIALVLALEGMPGIADDVELLETVHRLGVRIGSVAHFGRSAFADGSGEDAAGSRLTRTGIRALAEMERIGMIFDISHLGAGGVDHVLELATRPVMATHSSARALFDHHRNLTDAQIAGVAASGGVVCVNFFAPYLHESDYTIDTLVDHLERVASVAGIEHVGMGPDFVREVLDDTTAPCCVQTTIEGVPADRYLPGLEGPAGLPLVAEALLRRGWSEVDILAVLGGNLQRFLRSELVVSAKG